MLTRRPLHTLILLLMFLTCMSVPTQAAQMLWVSPENPKLQYVGRFSSDYTSSWTGSTVRCRFVGTSIAAKLITQSKKISYQVIVDGKPTKMIMVTPQADTYILAENLPAGEHTVELFRRCEAYFGAARLGGFELSEGAKLLTVPVAKRKVMVIGDSITCAYGSEEPNRSKGNTAENENGYMSYAAITARNLDADIMMVCWSCRGMYRNRNLEHKPGQETMPVLFDRIIPQDKNSKWDINSYKPQVVIINLGTNDLYRGKEQKPALTQENYLGAYRQIVAKLKANYPGVQIFACIGPMAHKPVSDWLTEYQSEDEAIHTVIFPGYNGVNEDIGGHWHPANSKMIKMADQLTGDIKTVLKW
ncbi:MAG: SGNH/GDSL hydrolase family protein [Phycisphaeraceae bacterium JB051]